ncbi:MAG: DegQ family serine endoprotease [Rhodoferax sp.]
MRVSFKKSWTAAVAASMLTVGAVSGVTLLVAASPAHAQASVRALPDFTDLVEQVSPSVVNIRTLEKVSAESGSAAPGEREMQEFFRRFGIPMPNIPHQAPRRGPPQQEEQPRGVGSGFILSSDGYIMTNAHVVDGADEVIVTLTDKREFKAKIVGADKRSDVAVVKIDAKDLPAVKVGDVSRLKVGEWVLAIGSPFGLENTVTAGIVSAKQRDTGDYLPFIQTDVAINPGNSGGPLINMRGEVVGINSQIYSRSGGSMGISFSIPMDEAVRVSDQLRATGRVTRGRIGVQIEAVTKEVASSMGLDKPQGALVRAVESGAPADKAGVQAGDVIVKFDGKPVEKSSDLPRMVGAVKPGTQSTVTVWRDGKMRDLSVKVAEIEPEKAPVAAAKAKPNAAKRAQALGLALSELGPEARKELGVRGGVRVEGVAGAAARAGLREGDVILAVANTAVASIEALEQVLAKQEKAKALHVLFQRGAWSQYTLIRPE